MPPLMYSLTWLADALRQAGMAVVEEPGWKDRGRGEFGPPKGVLIHHTASNAKGGDAPDLGIVVNGRADPPLTGPLCNLLLSRSAVFHVIAAGRANHAGPGMWHGVTQGNSELIGIEAENDGVHEPWPSGQMDALVHGTATILKHVGADSVMAAGHKEYALPRGRKVDPDFDMIAFREHVENVIDLGATVPLQILPVVQTDPARSMLRKGDHGVSVAELQRLLGIAHDGFFGPMTEAAVKQFQKSHGLAVDGLVGPATWRAIGH